jgi:hypothetical protein
MECNVCTARADVAQLVEQRFRKPQVTGSNPVVGSSLRSQQRKRKLTRRSLGGGKSFDPRQFFVASYGLAGTRLRNVGVRRLNVGAPLAC